MAPFAEGTTVSVAKTRAEIEDLVTRYGATTFSSGWGDDNTAHISFRAKGRLVRFLLRMPTPAVAAKKAPRRASWMTPTEAQKTKWLEGETRRLWRCLLLTIKAKLETVRSGIYSFDEEFLPHIVGANDMTIYEVLTVAQNSQGQRLLPPPDPEGGK